MLPASPHGTPPWGRIVQVQVLEKAGFRTVIYTSCAAPPSLIRIHFLSRCKRQTPETAAKGEAAGAEGLRPRRPEPVCPSGMEGAARPGPARPGPRRGVQPGTRPPHPSSQKQLAVLAGPGAPPPGPITPQRTPEIARSACPSPELVVLGRAAGRLGPPTRAQGHTAGPRLSGASAASRSLGSGPHLRSPHPEWEEEEEGSTGFPTQQLPLASALPDSDGGRKRRLLPPPGATRKYTLHA